MSAAMRIILESFKKFYNRDKESFVRGKADPVHELGFFEKELDKDGNRVPLKPKKNYIAFVIDRSDNKLKVMEVK
ncbi:hypothetical protein, partial [Enterococcus faecalis]|uniref:hypothetical protein n=1 Tax=Enterococcus faecalis TaxID=1351 RepID=UPI003984DD4F